HRFVNKATALAYTAVPASYGVGTVYFELENFARARTYFMKAMEKGMNDGDVYYMIGLSLQKQGQSRFALPSLQRAAELNEQDVDYLFQYGLSLAQCNQLEEAAVYFNKVLSIQPNH